MIIHTCKHIYYELYVVYNKYIYTYTEMTCENYIYLIMTFANIKYYKE